MSVNTGLYKEGALVLGNLSEMGWGCWPAIVITRDHYVWSTAHDPERSIAPREDAGYTYCVTMGDRRLCFVDARNVKPYVAPAAHRSDSQLYKRALKDADEYASGRVGHYFFWHVPRISTTPYVATFVKTQSSGFVANTYEGGDEVVDAQQIVRWIGKGPCNVQVSTPLAAPAVPTRMKIAVGSGISPSARAALCDIQKRRKLQAQKQEDKRQQHLAREQLFIDLFGEDANDLE